MSLIISNEASLSLPPSGETNSYDVDFEKLKFFVNNHFLTPVKTCYSVELSNPVSLEKGNAINPTNEGETPHDQLKIKIKIPRQILGNKFGYELEGLDTHPMSASLRLKSSDGCRDVSTSNDELEITKEAYCGWFIVTLTYYASEDVCNLCGIAYSLCFDPLKLKTLYGVCDGDDKEVVNFNSETCVEICNPADISSPSN